MKKQKYVESYPNLCKTTVFVSLMLFVLHLLAVFALDYAIGSGAMGKAIAGVLLPRIAYIKFIPMYVENYKYLVQKQAINNSKKLFWYGMLPFIIEEVLNIAVLVLVLCL